MEDIQVEILEKQREFQEVGTVNTDMDRDQILEGWEQLVTTTGSEVEGKKLILRMQERSETVGWRSKRGYKARERGTRKVFI